MNELKRRWSLYDYFLVVAFMMVLGTGVAVTAQSNGGGHSYYSAVERLWKRITNPSKSYRCQNALKQTSLAIPSGVQTGKETK
jgi:hypothetical protein